MRRWANSRTPQTATFAEVRRVVMLMYLLLTSSYHQDLSTLHFQMMDRQPHNLSSVAIS